jgi:hypothetical protein
MAGSWQQIVMNLHEISRAQPLLPFISFAVGIAAMAWVVRRTALRISRTGHPEALCLNARSFRAHADIVDIAARQWLDKQATAMKFSRGSGTLTAQQLNFLAHVSSRQRVQGGQR